MSEKVQKLIQLACESGASGVAVIAAGDIVVEPGLADKCREPRCENYGLSKSCPPHVAGRRNSSAALKHFIRPSFSKSMSPLRFFFPVRTARFSNCFTKQPPVSNGMLSNWDLPMHKPTQGDHARRFFAMTTPSVLRYLKRGHAGILNMQDLPCPDSESSWRIYMKKPDGPWAV